MLRSGGDGRCHPITDDRHVFHCRRQNHAILGHSFRHDGISRAAKIPNHPLTMLAIGGGLFDLQQERRKQMISLGILGPDANHFDIVGNGLGPGSEAGIDHAEHREDRRAFRSEREFRRRFVSFVPKALAHQQADYGISSSKFRALAQPGLKFQRPLGLHSQSALFFHGFALF